MPKKDVARPVTFCPVPGCGTGQGEGTCTGVAVFPHAAERSRL